MPRRQPRPFNCCPHCLGPIKWYTSLETYQTILECAEKPDEHMRIEYNIKPELSEREQVELFRVWEHELVMVGLSNLVGYRPTMKE
jgi:hypothetical protein